MTRRTTTRRSRRAGGAAPAVEVRRGLGVEQLSLLGGCLDERDRAVLAFARAHHWQGAVADQIHRLGVSQTRYYLLLARLLERVEVAEAEPDLVAQLHALRERRRRLRSSVPS